MRNLRNALLKMTTLKLHMVQQQVAWPHAASSVCSSPGRSKAVLDNHDSFTSHALVELNSVLRPSTWAKIQSHQVEDELLLDRLEEMENREAPSVPVKRRVSGQKPDGNRYVT